MVTLIFFLDSRHSSITTFYLPKYAFKWTIDYASLIASWTHSHTIGYTFFFLLSSPFLFLSFTLLCILILCCYCCWYFLSIFCVVCFVSSDVWCEQVSERVLLVWLSKEVVSISLWHFAFTSFARCTRRYVDDCVHDSCEWIEWNWYVNCRLSAQFIMWTQRLNRERVSEQHDWCIIYVVLNFM